MRCDLRSRRHRFILNFQRLFKGRYFRLILLLSICFSTRSIQAHTPEGHKRIEARAYELLKTNPNHLSLHFKKVNKYWSVRVGKAYRALGIEVKNGILWFWIGTHDEYDRLISK